MYLNELMNARQMSRTELSARSRVPESTLRDILSGKTQLDRCEAATLYDLAGALQVSIEDILENYWEEMNAPEASRPVVQDEGSLASFYMLTETFLEQLHAMGLVDFLCRKNQVRKDARYEEYRKVRLDKPVYALHTLEKTECGGLNVLDDAQNQAIPELAHFGIYMTQDDIGRPA